MKYIIIILLTLTTLSAQESPKEIFGFYGVGQPNSPNAIEKIIIHTKEKIYLLKKEAINHTHFKNIEALFDQNHKSYIKITLTETGTVMFAKISERYVGRRLAVVINGDVISAAIINMKIDNGQIGIYTGMSTKETEIIVKKIKTKIKKD
jgi:preprotein translocase subunit SecD